MSGLLNLSFPSFFSRQSEPRPKREKRVSVEPVDADVNASHPRSVHSEAFDGLKTQLQGENSQLRQLLKDRDEAIDDLKRKIHRSSEKLFQDDKLLTEMETKLHDQKRLADQMLQETQSHVEFLESALSQAQHLIATKSVELEAANKFLVTADGAAVSDVKRAVQTLNAEIYQLSSTLAEHFSNNSSAHLHVAEISAGVLAAARHSLGQPLCKLLQHMGEDKYLAIQIAVRGALTFFCQYHIESWCLRDSKTSCLLRNLYWSFVQEGSSKLPLGTWRSMTRARLNDPTFIRNDQLVNLAAQTVACVLCVAGSFTASDVIQQALLSRHRDRFIVIVRTSLDLNRMIGEEIVSMDLHPVLVEDGLPFDPNSMEDAYEPDGPNNTVISTAELGVTQVVRAESGQLEQSPVVKPKVVLAAVFEDV